jgi:hypothetical protein
MKKTILFIILFSAITVSELSAQSAVMPSGDGSQGNPYQIATLNNLYWVTQNSSSWSDNFLQTADIDARDSKNWDIVTARFSDDTLSYGFSGIGNSIDEFQGTYDGNGYLVDSLHIFTLNGSDRGFFGKTDGATIKNLGITNADIKSGESKIGALVGNAEQSTVIENCFSTGTITMVSDPSDQGLVEGWGGLIGQCYNNVVVKNCYSSVDIEGGVSVAVYQDGSFSHYNNRVVYAVCGFVGWTYLSTINESFSTGYALGGNQVGGFVGHNTSGSVINDCYSFGKAVRDSNSQASSNDSEFGGFCGNNENAEISNCYSIGKVEYEVDTNPTDKGFAGAVSSDGSGDYKMLANFWDEEASTQTSTAGSTANGSELPVGKSTSEMKTKTTFTNAAWDFSTPIWSISEFLNDGYPFLYFHELSDCGYRYCTG